MLKRDLWKREFWKDSFYIATVSSRGDRNVIEKYTKNQGRADKEKQLKIFDI